MSTILHSPAQAEDKKQAVDWRAVPKQESAATVLRDRIIGGHYSPGHHLMEVPIAEELGISRTPVRDALTLLAQEGLLEPGPKRGYKVRTFTLDDILHAYETRGVLEGLACRLLAERGLPDALREKVARCLALGDELLSSGPFEAAQQAPWLEMNNSFHTALVNGPQNKMLASFVEQSQRIPLASARHVHWYRIDLQNFELARRAHADHHEIFDAIMKRQSARAESRMREHIYFSQQLVAKQFSASSGAIGFHTLRNTAPSAAP